MPQERPVLSVTELTRSIKHLLESGFPHISVQGEISNFKRHGSGHLYFTLKDADAQISGVMWRSRATLLQFEVVDGMKVVVTGRITVYEPRGSYQIETLTIRPLGIGELQIAFDQLKQKLAAEGLFDSDRKLRLPEYPERIGIITSPTGAVLHDMLNILRRRFPGLEVVFKPVKVQGPGAAAEIAAAIEDFNRLGGIDVLIVGRGGGSMEDLWAFNEEIVARAIYRSAIPVVSAVGHETDVTIADFVADLRAPTPSTAAEMVVKDRSTLLDIVGKCWYTMHENILTMLRYRRENIGHLLRTYAFNRPLDLLRQHSQRLDELERGMASAVQHHVALTRSRAEGFHHRILALDPALTLKRGYAIVRKDQMIIDSRSKVQPADSIEITFHDGTITSVVT